MPVFQNGSVYAISPPGGGVGQDIDATNSASFLGILSNSGTPQGVDAGVPAITQGNGTPVTKVSTLWYVAAVIIVIVALKFAMEHEKSGMQPAFVGIGVYNLLAVTLMAMIGLVVIKTILNKYQVPGLTNLVNAV